MSYRVAYALVGILLGVGAPLGALLLRWAFAGVDIDTELRLFRFFYLYELIGTCVVFGVAGWVAGRRADAMQLREEFYRGISERDELTQLANVRVFRDRYRRALDRAVRHGEPLSLLLIDVDGLKRLNDRYGHDTGSRALILVAAILTRVKRDDDLAARWGGDEFTLVMPGAGAEAARRVAETVVREVAETRLESAYGAIPLSISAGAATTGPRRFDVDLFHEADRALYEAKSEGRNRAVCRVHEQGPPESDPFEVG